MQMDSDDIPAPAFRRRETFDLSRPKPLKIQDIKSTAEPKEGGLQKGRVDSPGLPMKKSPAFNRSFTSTSLDLAPFDATKECLREYESTIENYSEKKIKEDIENIAAELEARLDEHIQLVLQIKENLRRNLVFSCNKRLKESEYSYYETMKTNIIRFSKDLSSSTFKTNKTSQLLSLQLQEIKEFKAMSAKIQKAYKNSMKQAEEVKKQTKSLLETFELGIQGFLPSSDMTLNIASVTELGRLRDEMKWEAIFHNASKLDVASTESVPVSTIWKGACLIEEHDMIALGGLHEISLYSWPSLEYLQTNISAHEKPIYRLAYIKEIQKLVSCSADGTLKLWIVSKNQIELSRKIELPGPVFSFEFCPKKQKIIAAGDFQNVTIINLAKEDTVELHCNFGAPILAIKLFDDEQYLAVANSKLGEIVVFDIGEREVVTRVREHKPNKPIWYIGYCPFRELIFSSGIDGMINIWAHTGQGKLKKRRRYENQGLNVTDLGIDGFETQMTAMISFEHEAQLAIFDIESGNPENIIHFPTMNSAISLIDRKRKQIVVVGNSYEGNAVIVKVKEE